MMKIFRRKMLRLLGFPKTLLFNFRYLPFSDAIKLPFAVSHRVWLMELGGRVSISGEISSGMIEIGFGEVGIFDQNRSRTIWQVSGEVEFGGPANIGHGSRLSVSGRLRLGKNFKITAESSLVATKEIVIGDDVLFSWDVLVLDTDFHPVLDAAGKRLNPDIPVIIGDRVWVGCRALLLKGVSLADGVVIAAGSVVSRPVDTGNSVAGGNPAAVLKENITWQR